MMCEQESAVRSESVYAPARYLVVSIDSLMLM